MALNVCNLLLNMYCGVLNNKCHVKHSCMVIGLVATAFVLDHEVEDNSKKSFLSIGVYSLLVYSHSVAWFIVLIFDFLFSLHHRFVLVYILHVTPYIILHITPHVMLHLIFYKLHFTPCITLHITPCLQEVEDEGIPEVLQVRQVPPETPILHQVSVPNCDASLNQPPVGHLRGKQCRTILVSLPSGIFPLHCILIALYRYVCHSSAI